MDRFPLEPVFVSIADQERTLKIGDGYSYSEDEQCYCDCGSSLFKVYRCFSPWVAATGECIDCGRRFEFHSG